MSNDWQKTQLSKILTVSSILSKRPDQNKRISVRLNCKGVEKRPVSALEDEGATTYYLRKAGQFIYGKQNLHKGAFGLVPDELNMFESSQDLPAFDVNTEEMYGEWLVYYLQRGNYFTHLLEKAKGTGSKRIHEDIFLSLEIPLPKKTVQEKVISKIKILEQKVCELKSANYTQMEAAKNLLYSTYMKYIENCDWDILENVAPIIRRKVKIENNIEYSELGLRSFGRGTFHKPLIKGSEIGTKRIYHIFPDDLLFSNIFSWEGAIAVAKPEDKGYVGSHRYITCLVDQKIANPHFLCYHFLSPKGMEDIINASPGSAGRNKTLGLSKLVQIKIPLPDKDLQDKHHIMQAKVFQLVSEVKTLEQAIDALIPSVLDKAFKSL
jgi:type I restriction enzyme S subunit